MYPNLIVFQVEIILFLISVGYIFYYILDKVFGIFKSVGKILGIKKQKPETPAKIVSLSEDKNLHAHSYKENNNTLSIEDKNKIQELLKKIQINISKGEYDVAKNIIIEGLTIDKFNISLNLELAGIYILEEEFLKAEYIYKDLLLVHREDFEVLKKLGYVLTMQEKYDLAIEMYKKADSVKFGDKEIVNMLSHLYYYKGLYIDAISYLKIALKDAPREVDNLILLGSSYNNIGKILDSINTYKRALEISPYNLEIKKEIEKLESLEYTLSE